MNEPDPRPQAAPVILVTGMAGAGRSTALGAFEDAGYESVDNLPLSMLPLLLEGVLDRPIAVGVDSRSRSFDAQALLQQLDTLSTAQRPIRILFLDCAGHELVRRFSETRRRHPLALDRPAGDGIAREREMLEELRRAADVVIDTTDYSSNDLRRAIATRFPAGGNSDLTLTIMSFAYARGVPRDADLMFDMRFLKNPHWVPELRPLTGTDPAVAAHVASDPAYEPAFSAIMALLEQLLPGYAQEGRAYVTVAFGCTGGRHRSVAVAEAAAGWLRAKGWSNSVIHRDRVLGSDALEGDAAAGLPLEEDGR